MRRTFMIVFVAATSFGALAYAMFRALLAGGGVVAGGLFALFALAATAGVVLLARTAYLDGVAARDRVVQAQELRRRL